MSTDTAMALGALSLLSRGASPRLRQLLITVLVADDIGSLVVIAAFYSGGVRMPLLAAAAAAFVSYRWLQRSAVSLPLLVGVGFAGWLLTRMSGVDPVVSGLVLGLLAPAYSPALGSLEHASRGMRSFREQPGAISSMGFRVTVLVATMALRGPSYDAALTRAYGDFECPYCGQAEDSLTTALRHLPAHVRYVWRHLPLVDVHPAAWRAALASEAAAAQGAFWPMHDNALLAHREELGQLDLVGLTASLGLDAAKFVTDFESPRTSHKVMTDVESARLSGVAGTPTLFVNGVRHEGDYGPAALLAAVRMVLQTEEERPQAERATDASGR